MEHWEYTCEKRYLGIRTSNIKLWHGLGNFWWSKSTVRERTLARLGLVACECASVGRAGEQQRARMHERTVRLASVASLARDRARRVPIANYDLCVHARTLRSGMMRAHLSHNAHDDCARIAPAKYYESRHCSRNGR